MNDNSVKQRVDSTTLTEAKVRDAGEIASRASALFAVVSASMGEDQRFVVDWLYNNALWEELTPKEIKFLSSSKPTRQTIVEASWRSQALPVLLWALGLVKEMPGIEEEVLPFEDLQLLAPPFNCMSVEEFVASAQCRSKQELKEMYDTIWQVHWSLRNAERNNLPKADPIHISIIEQRHRAILWILNSQDEPWDEIALHT